MLSKTWTLLILMMGLISTFPISLDKLKFIPIHKVLAVKANKKLPPHIAFMESHFEVQNQEWREFERKHKHPLVVGQSLVPQQGPYILTQKKELEGFVIRKSTEVLSLASVGTYKTQLRSPQNAEESPWLKNIVGDKPLTVAPAAEPLHNLLAARRVTGPLEITGGLAITNEHHIEVRRSDEGVFHEMGRVDLMKGTYSIDVDEASGAIIARLMDKKGAVLGEGGIRLNQLQAGTGALILGPRIAISPSPVAKGRLRPVYNDSKKHVAANKFRVTTTGRQNILGVSSDGEVALENFAKNSTSILRTEAPDHQTSSAILVAGAKTFDVPLFPISMMEAFKAIVADQDEAKRDLIQTSIVWGTVRLDGKPLSGVTVISEADPEKKPVYFNEFLIPDAKLSATTSNGLYAFLNLSEGFHALLAQRGNSYFGHQNVEVEVGTVAVGDIENTLRTEPVRVRAFDAFSGEPISLAANLQSLTEPVEILEGSASVVLPQVSRFSIAYTQAPPPYLSANYFYNDEDSYFHFPMVSQDWMVNMKATMEVNDVPTAGIVVGFFSEENFEVYLAGEDPHSQAAIVYFDAAGKKINVTQGVAGGGFVIFNVSSGTQEVVVVGAASEKIYSKVVPVSAESVSVLSFSSH